MQQRPTLHVRADVNELASVRDFVEQQAGALGVAPDTVYDLVLAANEIATNIVVHGYNGHPGTIDIMLYPQGDTITIVLRDHAPLFDPTTAPTPDIHVPLEKRKRGGMGIHLTRKLTDEMQYRATAEGENEITLVKRGVIASNSKE